MKRSVSSKNALTTHVSTTASSTAPMTGRIASGTRSIGEATQGRPRVGVVERRPDQAGHRLDALTHPGCTGSGRGTHDGRDGRGELDPGGSLHARPNVRPAAWIPDVMVVDALFLVLVTPGVSATERRQGRELLGRLLADASEHVDV